MIDGNLLIFGCAVCLIAVAGAYVYLREGFSGEQKPLKAESHNNAVTQEWCGVSFRVGGSSVIRSSIASAIRQRPLRILPIVFAAIFLPISIAHSAEIEGVRFPDQLQMGEAQLQLRGAGLLRYRTILKAYVAALYLEESTRSEEILGESARRLEIEYFWSIPADQFAKATVNGISQNVDAATLESLEASIAAFNALYEEVESGDRYSITYLPGLGTELALNGEAKGVVEGADFAAALFAIWFGPNPLDEKLRRKLLAQR
jgi:hypothetical protein